jgi:hypothetical protein
MNQELTLVIIGVVVAALVLRPLIRGGASTPASPVKPSPARDAASSDELAELELDHAMGRVSETDYARWRGQLEPGTDVVEQGVVETPKGSIAKAEALVTQWRAMPRSICARCGERPEPEARFCSNCGASLQGQSGV